MNDAGERPKPDPEETEALERVSARASAGCGRRVVFAGFFLVAPDLVPADLVLIVPATDLLGVEGDFLAMTRSLRGS